MKEAGKIDGQSCVESKQLGKFRQNYFIHKVTSRTSGKIDSSKIVSISARIQFVALAIWAARILLPTPVF